MAAYAPSALELLDVWEAGHALPPVQRALALLTVARPDVSPQALAEMPVGRRDSELLVLRERLFGPGIVALARCPGCAERFELTFTVADIQVTPPEHAAILVQRDDYAVRVRPANSVDLMDTHAGDDPAATERALIGRCTLEAWRGAARVLADELPDAVAEAIAHAMSTADPQADVQMATVCPACGHRWDALFDVAAFLWREVEAWAQRTLDEVHALASAYGWSEREILSMSASRRRRYVAMIAQGS
jgi:uncharacterized protein (UPF0212 family)